MTANCYAFQGKIHKWLEMIDSLCKIIILEIALNKDINLFNKLSNTNFFNMEDSKKIG